MKKIMAINLALVSLLSGCTTMHFDKGENVQASVTIEKWHHNFALSLVEGSQPVNPVQECVNTSWVSVKTELSFLNALGSGAANQLGPIWYPKTVEISCK